MSENILKWLQNWFFQNCNGEWEERKRFYLRNIDNPGWRVSLYLEDSIYDSKEIDEIIIDRTDHDWCYCLIKNKEIMLAGGPFNLEEMLNNFYCCIEEKKSLKISKSHNELIKWMQAWYYQYCDEDWEHADHFIIKTNKNPGWSFSINIEDTHCDGHEFIPVKINNNETDWFHCYLDDELRFKGEGGVFNLIDILQTFRKWADKCQNES